MDRTPPPEVRQVLRREVGFGCPVEGCASPYLSWHHFNPPWAEREHHDPEGIVALCVLHHGQADMDAFTPAQLRAFKDPGRNGAEERVRGRFHWRRERLILLAGGNWWTGCQVLLQCGPTPIIWLTRGADGYELLNIDLYDDRGRPRLQMRDNDWMADRDVSDLECPPRKASLVVKTEALGAELAITFGRATPDAVRRHAVRLAQHVDDHMPAWVREQMRDHRRPSSDERAEQTVEAVLAGMDEEESALCVIEGKLRWPVQIALNADGIILPHNNVLSAGIVIGSHVGIQVN